MAVRYTYIGDGSSNPSNVPAADITDEDWEAFDAEQKESVLRHADSSPPGIAEAQQLYSESERPPEEQMPVISDVAATPESTTATITWTTDIAASSKVEWVSSPVYDTNGGQYDPTITDDNKTTSHSMTLSGLEPATGYHYRVSSDEAQSTDQTFTTEQQA